MKLGKRLKILYEKNKSTFYLLLPVLIIVLFYNFTIKNVSVEVGLYIHYGVLLFLTIGAAYLGYDTYLLFKKKKLKK